MGAGSTKDKDARYYPNVYQPQAPVLKKRSTFTPLKCVKCGTVIPIGEDHYKLGKKILCGICK